MMVGAQSGEGGVGEPLLLEGGEDEQEVVDGPEGALCQQEMQVGVEVLREAGGQKPGEEGVPWVMEVRGGLEDEQGGQEWGEVDGVGEEGAVVGVVLESGVLCGGEGHGLKPGGGDEGE